jgi:hypothetical protein
MRITILNPDPSHIRKWGILAHLSPDDRERALAAPHGELRQITKRLEKELEHLKKQHARKG